MRCHVCDKALTDTEIQASPSGHGYEPCSVCMEIALDAAYCDGFVREDPLEEIELDDDGSLDTLELDTFRTVFDHCDPGFQSDHYRE